MEVSNDFAGECILLLIEQFEPLAVTRLLQKNCKNLRKFIFFIVVQTDGLSGRDEAVINLERDGHASITK
jgi:hypothetical protein